MTQTTEELLAQRKTTHGEYSEHARCTQAIMAALQRERGFEALPDIVKESLHMFAHKMGRVVTGNWTVKDHYDDIAGYATLISQRLEDKVGLLQGHRPVDLHGGREHRFREVLVDGQPATDMGGGILAQEITQSAADRGKRENIGHPGELSARALTKEDYGRILQRRDGALVVLTSFENNVATVMRGDNQSYMVDNFGFMMSSKNETQADIRQVILG